MARSRTAGDRTWLVALAATLWGVSSLWRGPLAQEYPSLAIVFWEHAVLTVLTAWWLVPALRRLARASRRTQASVLVIGAGSSALATVMFTAAFATGDPITPQVLQKLQPLIAVGLAAVLLGERLRRTYLWFALPALVGAWLLAFPDPLSVGVSSAQAALLALGAAALWAAGTVLGRAASAELGFADLTSLRFALGLVTLSVTAMVTATPLTMGTDAAVDILLLALFPGCSRSPCTTARSGTRPRRGPRSPSSPSPCRRWSSASRRSGRGRRARSGSASPSSSRRCSPSPGTSSAAPGRPSPSRTTPTRPSRGSGSGDDDPAAVRLAGHEPEVAELLEPPGHRPPAPHLREPVGVEHDVLDVLDRRARARVPLVDGPGAADEEQPAPARARRWPTSVSSAP